MKATSLLESQHRQVAALIDELTRPGADRKALTEKLATAILAHMVIEEEIFYPQAEKVHRELTAHGFEDHESEIPVLLRLAATPAHDERFSVRLSVLKALLEHHIHEEEAFLFPAVNRAFPAEKNAHLGQQMKARFDQVLKGGLVGALKVRIEEAERRAPAGITAIGTCLAESGKERKGQSEKGQSEKGRSEKGQPEKGRSGKGRSHRKGADSASCDAEESQDSQDETTKPESERASREAAKSDAAKSDVEKDTAKSDAEERAGELSGKTS